MYINMSDHDDDFFLMFQAHIAYLPNKKVVGLSKLARYVIKHTLNTHTLILLDMCVIVLIFVSQNC